MTEIETQNSTYELDTEGKRVRIVRGKGTTRAPIGEWRPYIWAEVSPLSGQLIIRWPDSVPHDADTVPITLTSRVRHMREVSS